MICIKSNIESDEQCTYLKLVKRCPDLADSEPLRIQLNDVKERFLQTFNNKKSFFKVPVII